MMMQILSFVKEKVDFAAQQQPNLRFLLFFPYNPMITTRTMRTNDYNRTNENYDNYENYHYILNL